MRVLGLIFLSVWLIGTVWFLFIAFDAAMFQRMGSLGTVGIAIYALSPRPLPDFRLIFAAVRGTTPEVEERAGRSVAEARSANAAVDALILIVTFLATLQWGFGDLLGGAEVVGS